MKRPEPPPPVAIVGLGCLFPQAADRARYWSNILGRLDAITEVPPTHWRPEDYFDSDPKKPDHTYARRGGFLSPVDFPALDFGITPNTLEATDTSQLLGLMVAKQALDDAGYGTDGKKFDRSRVSVILGVTGTLELVIPLGARLGHPQWRRAMADAGIPADVVEDAVGRIAASYVGWQEDSFPGLLGNVVAGRIANRLDLGGTNCVVDAACASSLSALHLALFELAVGRADMVLTGGMDTFNDIFMYMCFSKTPALSPTGNAKPFDAGGDGTILGEGLGCVVLKRLADAERDGDTIYAVIKSVGTSSDGKGHAIYAPSPAGQVRALKKAYELAGITPDTIDLVEAHGTGTRAGDAAEVEALMTVYREARASGTWCALGSVKSQLGHTKAAAGAAGLIKAALALHHKVLPPTIKVEKPIEPLAPGKSPFYLNTEARPWLPSPDHPRRAAVSSFGFGGSNFHCVLEEYRPQKAAVDWDGDVQLLAFSGDTEEHLLVAVEAFPAAAKWEQVRIEAACTRSAFRATEPCRLLIVLEREKSDPARVLGGIRGLMQKFAGRSSWSTPDGVYFGKGPLAGKLAVLFPGQGAQYVGMFRDLACRFPQVQQALAEADAIFAAEAGPRAGRLSDRIYPHPAFSDDERTRNEEALRQTDVAQPALGALAVGSLRLLAHFSVKPEAAAGHSFGELPALWAAGRYDTATLHRLARVRGKLMATGTGDRGAMLAVQATPEAVARLLRDENLKLVIANKNTPKQVVLSGPSAEVRRAVEVCSRLGLTAKQLPVAAAFHSSFVADVRQPFATALAGVPFLPASIPVFSNTTGGLYPPEPGHARSLLAGQLAAPVEFVDEIQNLHRSGVHTFLEVGPGARLTAMVGAILDQKPHAAVSVDASAGQRTGVADLGRALAQLAALGHAVDLKRWDDDIRPEANTAKKPTLTVPICGANYVKPRTPKPPTPSRPAIAPPPAPVASAPPPPPAIVKTPVVPVVQAKPAAMSMPTPTPSGDPSLLGQALRVTQENLQALQKLGEQTARLHGQFLDNQNKALAAFQAMLEQQQRLIHGSVSGAPLPMPAPAPLPLPAPVVVAPSPAPAYVPPPAPVAPTPSPAKPAPLPSPVTRAPDPAPAPVARVVAQPAPAPAPAPAVDPVAPVLLSVVSEKTGYPAEMLGLDMELDADLGIDSIKRVEIFSVLQEKLPSAPAIKPEHLGGLRSLRDVVTFLGGGAASATPTPVIAVPAASVPATVDSGVADTLLTVVSEKTGYPAEMLGLDMELDADLGIDSIKRVEIFSVLQEKMPSAPAIKPEHLGGLRSLRDVVTFLGGAPAPAVPAPAPVVAAPAPPVPVATVEEKPAAPLKRYVLERIDLDSQREPIALPAGEVWVTDDGHGLGSLLVARLGLLGHRPRLIAVKDLPGLQAPATLAGLVIVAPADAGDSFLRDSFRLLQLAGPALRQGGKSGGSIFATVARLDGAFGLDDLGPRASALSGGLSGLSKTAAHEWPEVHCKAIDLDADFPDPDEAALAVAEELLLAGPLEVGIAAGRRSGLHLADQPLDGPAVPPLGKGDVVVITGGARGVTAEAAVALAQSCGCTLALLGRSAAPAPEPDWLTLLTTEADIKKGLLAHAASPLSPRDLGEHYHRVKAEREIRQTFERIRTAGARVVYHAVDVRDANAVRTVLAEVRSKVGPIRGVVHGAGVLADRRIEEQTPEQFDGVCATKVAGLRALLAATEKDDLKVLALFSSSTGRFGRTGQVAYAAANEVLNKSAQWEARRRPGCRVVSVNWGPWAGGMVTPALQQVFEGEGVGVIPLQAGAEYFVREISQPGPVEMVVLGGGSFPDLATATAAPAASNLPVAFERPLSVEALPVLRSHVIAGKAVLPMALVVEWLAHGALHGNPGLAFHGFDDLRILKGVRLSENQTWNVKVRSGKATRQDATYRVPVELHGSGTDGRDILHARATILLANHLPTSPESAPERAMPAHHRATADVYREFLFHGPDLQGIKQVQGCSDHGILATVASAPAPAEWLRQPLRGTWLADPMALDCAFQLMIVWSFENHGCGSLPAHAGRYRQYRRSFPREGVRILADVTRSNPNRAVADLWFVDKEGAVVARMQDYECVIDASLNQAFRRNQLTAEKV